MRQLRHKSRVLRGLPAERRRGRLRVVLLSHIGADGDGRADAGAYAGARALRRRPLDRLGRVQRGARRLRIFLHV